MILTIVLTVYNKKAFLEKVFNALINQQNIDEFDYEILVVNDGSTDGSLEIIEGFAASYRNIRVISQINQGLSMARNNGTVAANGEYIWYVDADDVISPNSVFLIKTAVETSPDIIPIYAKTEGIDKIRNCISPESKNGIDVLVSGRWEACGVFYIFKRNFLLKNNLRFWAGIYHEDSEFTPRMLYFAKKIVVIPEPLYTVIHEPNSITQVPRPKRAFDCLIVAESLSDFISLRPNASREVVLSFNRYISNVVNDALNVILKNDKEQQHSFNEALFNKQHLITVFCKSKVPRYRVEGFLFKLFPKRYTNIYRVLIFFKKLQVCQ